MGRFAAGLRVGLLAGTAAVALVPELRRLSRSWSSRVAVVETSMLPTLRPGDWLLVDPDAYRRRTPDAGDIVVVSDPREPDRLLVKRVVGVGPDGRLDLLGDDPSASTDSREFGPVEPSAVQGRPWARYWPPRRWGSLG
ncbi:MAG TPA: nickel-type superoxide dismutase maturation protease [Candidatus Limnocylindrales bacterium]|nr:nickel-type superoxide dismutase maturation protease [Candidatus Limnocylindrales bacterium]